MPEFYYQIKGKKGQDDFSLSNWTFPPIHSGKVEAVDKKDAKNKVCIEYERQYPTRVLTKDLDSNEFLLAIEEIKEGSHLSRLFELQTCKNENCKKTFYVIDKYNDLNSSYKGIDYCSRECKDEVNKIFAYVNIQSQNLSGSCNPVIYKITNKVTNKPYIGKTTQVFTLRWYQHFFQLGENKFHREIKSSKVTDWVFEIIEIVQIPEDIKSIIDLEKLISERERYWIQFYDSINNGYNSI